MYCTHCHPCPAEINIADVMKFLNLAVAHNESNGIKEGSAEFRLPDTERGHYEALEKHASDCLHCGLCETRCPFDVEIRKNMDRAEAIFNL